MKTFTNFINNDEKNIAHCGVKVGPTGINQRVAKVSKKAKMRASPQLPKAPCVLKAQDVAAMVKPKKTQSPGPTGKALKISTNRLCQKQNVCKKTRKNK